MPKFNPIDKAKTAQRESKYVDFKERVDLKSSADWCEILKDIIAMANSGGGIILIGVYNDGMPSGVSVNDVLKYDPANITNKIASYTNQQFSDFEIHSVIRNGKKAALLVVSAADTPIVFAKPGTYAVSEKQQKTAFSAGTVYFRHGAKSEPGTTEDIRLAIDRKIEQTRTSWLSGIRKVTQAPPGSTISVVTSPTVPGALTARVVVDPNAPGVVPTNADEVWPYRQGDVIKQVNARLAGEHKVNSHDIQCIRKVYDIEKKHGDFVYRPYKHSHPQYSQSFVDWIVTQYQGDKHFFAETRKKSRDIRPKQ